MVRQDVYKLADRLAFIAGMPTDHVYCFLMDVGKTKGVNPRKLDIRAINGMVYLNGEIDSFRLSAYVPGTAYSDDGGVDYEGLILARQEARMD